MTAARVLALRENSTRIVDLQYGPDTTWGMLLASAPAGLLPQRPDVDGVTLEADAVLTSTLLRDGSVIHPARQSHVKSYGQTLHVAVTDGPEQGTVIALGEGRHEWGRGASPIGDDPLTSRTHLRIDVRHGAVSVTDLNSANGTRIADRLLQPNVPQSWRIGESCRVGATHLKLILSAEPETAPVTQPHPEEFLWPHPPEANQRERLRWLTVLAPLPIAVVLALWLNSAVFLVMVLASPLLMLITSWDSRRTGYRSVAQQQRTYDEARADMANRIERALSAERKWLRGSAPDPATERLHGLSSQARVAPARSRPGLPGLRLGHGAASSCHLVRAQAGQLHPTLTDVPVLIPLDGGATVRLDCTPDTIDTAWRLVVARALAHCRDGHHRLVVVRAGTLGPWLANRPDVVQIESVDEANLEWLVPSPSGETVRPIVVLDPSTPGAHRLSGRWGNSSPQFGCLISIGAHGVSGEQTWSVRAGSQQSASPDGHRFTLDRFDRDIFDELTRHETHTHPPQLRASRQLPSLVLPPVDEMPLLQRWQADGSTSFTIGSDARGPVRLDLAAHGPHALVAGTTGSGKSEFLLAMLLELFRANSPHQLSALLIDYKGGATFGVLAQAPHVVSVITDLDEHMAGRAVDALHAEIRRRERALAAGGTLSRFLVVIDEFRELAEQIPEFIAGIVRLAALGRSLNIHVVLATQRPGGVVTADMRANLNLRVCLRVRERADSMDVLDSPGAHDISPDTPGRALIAHGGSTPKPVQVTYVGAVPPSDVVHWHVHPDEDERQANVPGLSTEQDPDSWVCQACHSPASGPGESALTRFLTEARESAAYFPRPHTPIHPPLPENLSPPVPATTVAGGTISLASLVASTAPEPDRPRGVGAHETPDETSEIGTPIGLADLPKAQAQPLVTWQGIRLLGIAGAPRSGRTSALAQIVRAAQADGWSILRPNDHDPQSVAEFLAQLDTHEPRRLVVIDDWEDFHAALLHINRGQASEQIFDIVRHASGFGTRFAIAGGRAVLTSRLAPLLEAKLMLRANDATDYALAGLRPAQIPTHLPPGRALVLPHAHEMQFFATEHSSPSGSNAAVAAAGVGT